MSKTLSRQQCLALDKRIYNEAIKIQWNKSKRTKNLSGDLSQCTFCERLYVVSCICDEGQALWNKVLQEVQEVSGNSTNY